MGAPGSIVMAVHRPDGELLRRQVDSVRQQTLTGWTCIVGIDGRDPEARARVDEAVGEDERFTVQEYDDNVGHYRNFERLLREVPRDAPWFALCDQDDRWHPDKLSTLADVLGSDAGVVCAMGQADVTDRNGTVLGRTSRRVGNLLEVLLKNQVTGAFLVGRPSLLASSLPFPDPTSVARHDHWLGVVAAATGRVVVLDEPLQDYVQHDDNAIGETDLTRTGHRLLGRSGAGALGRLDQVSLEVWGWRVAMATTLLPRVPSLAREDRIALEAVTRGHLSMGLARSLAGVALGRSVRPGIVAGTAAASLWWPLARRRARG